MEFGLVGVKVSSASGGLAEDFALLSPDLVESPLRSVDLQLRVVDVAAHATLTQVFVNPLDEALEVTYAFPMLPSATVCAFSADFSGVSIRGHVLEKDDARISYDSATATGHSACLLEMPTKDSLYLRLGQLPACAEAVVRLEFTMQLRSEGDHSLRLGWPTVIGARYPLSPSPHGGSMKESLDSGCVVGPGGAAFSLSASFEMHCAISGVLSPTHDVVATVDGTNHASASLDLPSMPTAEIVIQVTAATPLVSRCWLEPNSCSGGGAAALAVLYPEESALQKLLPQRQEPLRTEFIFVLDRSGSMCGDGIQKAAEALQLFLKSLPQDCLFNIVGFGSTYQSLFGAKSASYNAETLQMASEHAEQVHADLGGTEMLQPLEFIFAQALPQGFARSIILLTDGQVSNTESVFSLVGRYAAQATVFTVGIGSSVSHDLVEGLADVGGGTSEFVTGSENLQLKVIRQLQRALRPTSVRLTHVEWLGAQIVKLAPAKLEVPQGRITMLMGHLAGGKPGQRGLPCNGNRVLVSGLLRGIDGAAPKTMRLHFESVLGQTAVLDLETTTLPASRYLHAAVGRAMIEDVLGNLPSRPPTELAARARKRVVEIGTQLQVASRQISANSTIKVIRLPDEGSMQLLRWQATIRPGDPAWKHKQALEVACSTLSTNHPERLKAAMEYSACLRQAGRSDLACLIARTAFEDAIAELDNCSEDSYRDSIIIMQGLRDNLTEWILDEDQDAAGKTTLMPEEQKHGRSLHEQPQEQPPMADLLQPLVRLHVFDGSWAPSEMLAEAIGVPLSSFASQPLEASPEESATALVISFLELRLAARAGEWTLMVDKARAWLAGRLGAERLVQLMARAHATIQAS
eukprot:CAMPEP_0115749294 /NCGR_PEP_ID=MMETSP0272-20121206/94112_1 /TAXON_ID=71861 /ORGANISM="Scrippsiella trochoidea, Strain CCMP3099" /LENGTH=861 /DNA_ID=CAMNT_0003194329 /DNA_START=69 /DNA_END=2654 /DNA_ORIENTATION=+